VTTSFTYLYSKESIGITFGKEKKKKGKGRIYFLSKLLERKEKKGKSNISPLVLLKVPYSGEQIKRRKRKERRGKKYPSNSYLLSEEKKKAPYLIQTKVESAARRKKRSSFLGRREQKDYPPFLREEIVSEGPVNGKNERKKERDLRISLSRGRKKKREV